MTIDTTPPTFFWLVKVMGFIVILIFTMFCINTVLRKQWVERERLAYPIVRLPQEMARGDRTKGLLRSKTMWIGFSIAAGINLIGAVIWLGFGTAERVID